jgi:hypothetical protein
MQESPCVQAYGMLNAIYNRRTKICSLNTILAKPDQGDPVMATANAVGTKNLEKVSWYLKHHAHTVWDMFSPDQQDQMIADDLRAGTSVSLVLISVIAAGMILAAVTLSIILATT